MPLNRKSTSHPSAAWLTAFLLGCGLAGPASAQPATPASSAAPSEAVEIQRLIKDGQDTQALKLIDESLARNPRDPQMRFRRGVVLSLLERKQEALAVFQKLVEDHPDMPAPYNNIAVILASQGDYEKARQALERAIRTNPAYATAYQNLGDVYAQLASQAYSKALQLDKADTSVQPKLALLRELTSGTGQVAAAGPGAAPAQAAAASAKPPVKPLAPPAPAAASAPSPSPAPAVAAAPPSAKPAQVAAVAVPKASVPVQAVPAASAPASKAPATAIAKASAPAAGSTTTPAAHPSPAPSAHSADVESAIKSWAAAWSRRDLPAYYAAYTPEFSGQSANRKAWEQDRQARIASKKQIKVDLQDLQVTVDGDHATARFRQIYSSDTLSTSSRKTLQLVRGAGGQWLIKQESVGG